MEDILKCHYKRHHKNLVQQKIRDNWYHKLLSAYRRYEAFIGESL